MRLWRRSTTSLVVREQLQTGGRQRAALLGEAEEGSDGTRDAMAAAQVRGLERSLTIIRNLLSSQ